MRSSWISSALLLVGVLLVLMAEAWGLEQPSGARVPSEMGCSGGQPTGLAAAFACECEEPGVCNIGAPCPSESSCDEGVNGTCETTLWHTFNDNTCIPSNLSGLDPVAEAAVLPETFRPTCALTFTVVTRGTAIFGDAFGWYNVTGAQPDASDLHVMLPCDAAPGTEVVLDIQSHPDYAGGEIGFFLLSPESHTSGGTCAGGDCCATLARYGSGAGHVYYSQRAFNPDQAGASSFIHLLVYDSHVTAAKFYFAWEDIFGGSNNDFTDLVTSVEGVECSGGGAACDTGGVGACGLGITACQGGTLGCRPLVAAGAEACNGVDDDCDGTVDDGATCAGATEVCHGGRCVPDCEVSAEFDCPVDLACDAATGFCVDPGCESVSCPLDTVCRGGSCVTACDGVICPHGQSCVAGACAARCDGVACAAGEVCREGLCFPGCAACGGITCGAGLVCDDGTGDCLDPSCPGGCAPGTYCAAGVCVDACEGAVCPGAQVCEGGRCVEPGQDSGADAGPGGAGSDGPGVSLACDCRLGAASGSGSGSGSGSVMLLALALVLRTRWTGKR